MIATVFVYAGQIAKSICLPCPAEICVKTQLWAVGGGRGGFMWRNREERGKQSVCSRNV